MGNSSGSQFQVTVHHFREAKVEFKQLKSLTSTDSSKKEKHIIARLLLCSFVLSYLVRTDSLLRERCHHKGLGLSVSTSTQDSTSQTCPQTNLIEMFIPRRLFADDCKLWKLMSESHITQGKVVCAPAYREAGWPVNSVSSLVQLNFRGYHMTQRGSLA